MLPAYVVPALGHTYQTFLSEFCVSKCKSHQFETEHRSRHYEAYGEHYPFRVCFVPPGIVQAKQCVLGVSY